MPTISQILSASYEAVVNEMRKPANQWAESAAMREFERQGFIKKISMGPTIEHTLDYQANAGAEFLSSDLAPTSLSKVEVLTAASYTPGELSVPMVWSKGDEAKNASENQKVALVKSILENGIASHDDLIEEAIFSTSTNGFLGLQNVVPDSGQGSPGGIDASTDAWWRNTSDTYASAGTNLNAKLTAAFNTVSKGSGGAQPTLILSGATPQATYEASLQDDRRYIDVKEGDAGFKVLAFKTARWVFSQHGGTRIYGLSPKALRLNVSKEAFRQKGDTLEIPNANGFVCKIYSMLQMTTNNKSRLFVLTVV